MDNVEMKINFNSTRKKLKQQSERFILENIKLFNTRQILIAKDCLIRTTIPVGDALTTETSMWQRYAQMFNQLTLMERRIIYYKYLQQMTDVYAELNSFYSRSQYFKVKRVAEYEFAYLLGVVVY